ncbi:MAG: phytoene/squalene synthase family protein [Bradymonadia bacterium]
MTGHPALDPRLVAECRVLLGRKAQTFTFASRFLPAERVDVAAVVYAFCRKVDDAVDEAPDARTAQAAVDRLHAEIDGRGDDPVVRAWRALAEAEGFDRALGHELVEGCASDLGRVQVPDDDALVRYGYRVAGTVGLMMLGVLGIRDPRAQPYAVDLGVAMQLTNICRDVAEDARLGRVYLPAFRLARQGIQFEAMLAGTAPKHGVVRVVREVLDLAEVYYRSAAGGRWFSPAPSRLPVLVGAQVYRGIGRRLLRTQGGDPRLGRVVVPLPEKLLRAAQGALVALSPGWPPPPHDPRLHRALRGLPGANPRVT